jgi:hypothetical protein
MSNAFEPGALTGVAPTLARVFGVPNPEVNAWGITKKEHGKWVRQTHPDANGTHLREWPLSELTLEEVRDRWGAGSYRVQWFVHDPEHEEPGQRHRSGGTGPVFELEGAGVPRVTVPQAPPAPTPSAATGGFDLAVQFMRMADERVSSQLTSIATLAQAIAGGNNNRGVDATVLQLLLDKQQSQFASLVERMSAAHEAQLTELRGQVASLRSEIEDEEDDDAGSAVSSVAKTAIPRVKKGDSFFDAVKMGLGNYFLEDPGRAASQAVAIASAIPGALDTLSKAVNQAQPPPQPLPRANIATVHPMHPMRPPQPQPQPQAPPPAVVVVAPPGLNEALRDAAPTPAQPNDAAGE